MSQENDRASAKAIAEATGDVILGYFDLEELAELISGCHLAERQEAIHCKRDLDLARDQLRLAKYESDNLAARQRAELAALKVQVQGLSAERDKLRDQLQEKEYDLKARKQLCIEMVEAREEADRKSGVMEEAVRKAHWVIDELRRRG